MGLWDESEGGYRYLRTDAGGSVVDRRSEATRTGGASRALGMGYASLIECLENG